MSGHAEATPARGPLAEAAEDSGSNPGGPKLRTDLGEPRLFCLVRIEDVSGVSGEGRVADGVQWPDGRVSIRWRTTKATTVDADSIEDVEEIHGHEGRTRVAWADPDATIVMERPCSRSTVSIAHGSHWWVRECGTSVYDYWCPGRT